MSENASESIDRYGDSKDFMLAQYQALSDSFWRNEELGERRVNFLITLATAVIAAIVALVKVEKLELEVFLLPSTPAVSALLLLGLVTWRRMLHRNRVTDEYKRAMGTVRSWFETDDPQLVDHRPFPRLLLFSLNYGDFAGELPNKGEVADLVDPFRIRFDPANERLGAEPRIRGIEDGRRWLVYSKERNSTWRIWRRHRYLMKRADDKLIVYKPRKPSWGGLAEMVAVMNSVFVGALTVLLVLGLALICKGEDFSIDPLLGPALFFGFCGIIGTAIVQCLGMTRYHEGYDILVTKGDLPLMTRASHRSRESEVALVIWSRQPQQVVVRIADLSSICGYQLVPQGTLEMHDLYFDTKDRAFEPQRLALRLRATGPEWLIALKGPSRPTDWGGVERLEIEEPWSHDALVKVVSALANRGIETPKLRRFSEGHPGQVLKELGFQVIQDRKTHRQVRNIVRVDKERGPTLAELAIDSVLYRSRNQEIRHHEVEIEAKTEVGVSVIPPVIDALTAMFDDELKVWDHSKLAIGFALEEVLHRGDLEGLIDLDGNLMPAAYDKIDDYLTSSDS